MRRAERDAREARVAIHRRGFLALASWAAVAPIRAAESPLRLPAVDEGLLRAAGFRKLAGTHLTLFTDLRAAPEIDELPLAFDLAFPQWCEYFRVDAARHSDWRVTGFLGKDRSRFEQARVLPLDVPDFHSGFSWNHRLWCYEQASDYYRRHLLLHEGTHSFMNTLLGHCGPSWYMEGVAELLATHRWQDGRLTLNYFPADKADTPMWGRIKVIKDDYAAQRAKPLEMVFEYRWPAMSEVEPYAWCWAAAVFFDRHPRYRDRFRQLVPLVRQKDFTARFRQMLAGDWAELREEWQVFVTDLEYGYDVARAAVEFAPGQAIPPTGGRATVEAARGWQSSRLRLEAGKTYRLRAAGRYQVADRPQTWWCEPGGVSIRYYRGRPLGIVLAAVRPDEAGPLSALLDPMTVGLEATIKPPSSGTLYLRINDSAAELADNAGTLTVTVDEVPAP